MVAVNLPPETEIVELEQAVKEASVSSTIDQRGATESLRERSRMISQSAEANSSSARISLRPAKRLTSPVRYARRQRSRPTRALVVDHNVPDRSSAKRDPIRSCRDRIRDRSSCDGVSEPSHSISHADRESERKERT